MIIEKGFGNHLFVNVVIENYYNLESIIVKKNALMNLHSLRICNNGFLKNILIEDDNGYNNAFCNVKSVIFESTLLIDIIIDIFRIYNQLLLELIHSY